MSADKSTETTKDDNVLKPSFPKMFRLGTSKETIIEAMENAKEGEKFVMELALTPKGWGDPKAQEQREELNRKREDLRLKAKDRL